MSCVFFSRIPVILCLTIVMQHSWGMNNQAASALAGGVISSYMHWKDPAVPGLDAMFMPMYELSNDYYGELFNQVIADMDTPPTVLLGQNEIDADATYADPAHAFVSASVSNPARLIQLTEFVSKQR